MMSPGHSISGATAGYVACWLIELTLRFEMHWLIPHIVAVIVAGWANWPDCDSRKSTVTTSLGFLTYCMHKGVCIACEQIYYATATPRDSAKPMIHRGATHTWPGAVVMGATIGAICIASPRWGVPIVLGISLHWAARGIYIPKAIDKPIGRSKLEGRNFIGRFFARRYYGLGVGLRHAAIDLLRLLPLPGKYLRALGRTGTAAVCMAIAFDLTWFSHDLDTYWAGLLGGAATLGILVHMVGDSVTEMGICWLFPFVHPGTGKRWHPVHLPEFTLNDVVFCLNVFGRMRYFTLIRGRVLKVGFKTGRAFEYAVVYPACIIGAVLAMPGGYALVEHVLTAWRNGVNVALALPFAACPTRPPAVMPPPRCGRGAPRTRRPPNRKPCSPPPTVRTSRARPRSVSPLTRPPRRTP
jgi:membrane-bound metal-dependent hydrolase YbcI (DUF457 family)